MEFSRTIDIGEAYSATRTALENGYRVDEDIGDWLIKKVRDARSNVVQELDDGQFLNVRKNAFKQIMHGRYRKALSKMERYNIKYNSASPSGIRIFRHRYEKLPFAFGAVAYEVYYRNYKRVTEICDTIRETVDEVFGNHVNEVMKLRASESPRYNDLVSFCLTWGAEYPPKARRYTEEGDAALSELIESLVEMGWNVGQIMQTTPGLGAYILKGDFVTTAKYLIENGMLTLTEGMLKRFKIDVDSRMGKLIYTDGVHPFRLHEPDVVLDSEGRIDSDTDGLFASKMHSLGYLVSEEGPQPVSFQTLMAIQEELAIIVRRYTQQNKERISNLQQINIFKNSNFDLAKQACREYAAAYSRIVAENPPVDTLAQQLGEIATGVSQALVVLQQSANSAFAAMGLPEITIQFRTDTSRGIDANNVPSVLAEMGAHVPTGRQEQPSREQGQEQAAAQSAQPAQPQDQPQSAEGQQPAQQAGQPQQPEQSQQPEQPQQQSDEQRQQTS